MISSNHAVTKDEAMTKGRINDCRQIYPLLREVFLQNGVGGTLYSVIGNGNLRDSAIQSAIRNPASSEAERACAEMFLKLSFTQRRKVYRDFYDSEYYPEDDKFSPPHPFDKAR